LSFPLTWFIFWHAHRLLMILEIMMAHHYHFLCPLYSHVEACHFIIMNERPKFHLLTTLHPWSF
jgi:hypothetical protein